MRIGEVAQATGTSIETIRYYEREGLLPAPARSEGNYRIYEAAHVDRLLFIRHCRRLDMTQDEIRGRPHRGARSPAEAPAGHARAMPARARRLG